MWYLDLIISYLNLWYLNFKCITIMKNYAVLLVIMIGSLGIISCKKYEEGGVIAKAEKNIVGTWKFESYFRNGNNETNLMVISNYQETYSEGGKLSRTYTDSDQESDNDTGSWELTSDGAEVKIQGVGSIDVTEEVSSISSPIYTILKLTKDEFWCTFTNGGDTHQLRFKK